MACLATACRPATHFLMNDPRLCVKVKTEENEDELLFFRVAEAIFVGWFTIEYLVRFVVAPKKVIN